MKAGRPIPAPAARWLYPAFEAYLQGKGNDITASLGLRPRRGGRFDAPVAIVRRRQRDEIISAIAARLPDKDKGAACAAVIGGAARIDDAELAAEVEKLRAEFAGELPTSARQYQRILAGDGRHRCTEDTKPDYLSSVWLLER